MGRLTRFASVPFYVPGLAYARLKPMYLRRVPGSESPASWPYHVSTTDRFYEGCKRKGFLLTRLTLSLAPPYRQKIYLLYPTIAINSDHTVFGDADDVTAHNVCAVVVYATPVISDAVGFDWSFSPGYGSLLL